MELFEHWNAEGSTRSLIRCIAVGLGVIEPPRPKGSTSPEEIALQMGPQGFGGAVLPVDALPEWVRLSIAKWESGKPSN